MADTDWDTLIKEQEALSKKCEEKHDLDFYYSNPYAREVNRLYALKELDGLGVKWEHGNPGVVIIENDQGKKYHYALMSGRWRVCGKKTWYYSKSLEQFIEKYLNNGL